MSVEAAKRLTLACLYGGVLLVGCGPPGSRMGAPGLGLDAGSSDANGGQGGGRIDTSATPDASDAAGGAGGGANQDASGWDASSPGGAGGGASGAGGGGTGGGASGMGGGGASDAGIWDGGTWDGGGRDARDAAAQVDAPPPGPDATEGLLTLARAAPTNVAVDLTAEGRLDWVHWGRGVASAVNRKAGVPALIAPLVAGGSLLHYNDRATKVSWNDGAPTPAVVGITDAIYHTAVGKTFEVVAQASPSETRVLKVHVGAWEARAKLAVGLSDSAAPPLADGAFTTTGGNGEDVVYTITFRSRSAGATVRAVWTLEQVSAAEGNVTIQAASLRAQ